MLLATATASCAFALDRSGQDVGAIFEEGNFVQLSYGSVTPTISGTDDPTPYNPGGAAYDNVGLDFGVLSGSITFEVNDRISFALIVDQPFGADIANKGAPNTWLGGTQAPLVSFALTALGHYR